MAIKLTTISRNFVPDVFFPTEEGEIVSNRDLAPEEQVSCEITLASIGQKTEYLGSYTVGNASTVKSGEIKQFTVLQYEKCVRKHCKRIKGLEAFDVTTGRSLVEHNPTPELNEIIQEIFFKVNGIHSDDSSISSDSSDFSSKELKASE